MDERDPDVEPVRHETTIINAGGERDGGGGAVMLALIVALLAGIAAFLYFGGYLGGGKADTDINVNIKTPDININPPGSGNSTQ
ncbi:MAG TPA: hypothetical protein VEC11_04910 [Allosphingosinicella sp.]|nr:hypothetical protein [Allosphingosinicella sp.]